MKPAVAVSPSKPVAAAKVAEKPLPVKSAAAAKANGRAKRPLAANAAQLEEAGVAMQVDLNGGHASPSSEQFARFQLDAPSCDNCGAITVRNGNCYLCYNCGNSMGCS